MKFKHIKVICIKGRELTCAYGGGAEKGKERETLIKRNSVKCGNILLLDSVELESLHCIPRDTRLLLYFFFFFFNFHLFISIFFNDSKICDGNGCLRKSILVVFCYNFTYSFFRLYHANFIFSILNKIIEK